MVGVWKKNHPVCGDPDAERNTLCFLLDVDFKLLMCATIGLTTEVRNLVRNQWRGEDIPRKGK